MASYIDNNLMKDEQVLHSGKISLWSLVGYIIAGIILLPAMGIGLLFFLAAYLKYISTELAVTNKRVIAKTGFISRNTIEMNLTKVESMQVDQSIFGRMLNFGSLRINGTGASNAPITGIRAPLEFRRHFMEAQDQYSKA